MRADSRLPIHSIDARTAEELLESVLREPNPDTARRMMAWIYIGLSESGDPAAWIAAARRLRERLVISEDAFYHFANKLTECVVSEGSKHDPELVRLEAEIRSIERAGGLEEGEYYSVADSPPELRALDDLWSQRAHHLVAEYLRTHGHADVASLIVGDYEDYCARVAAGRIALWGDEGM